MPKPVFSEPHLSAQEVQKYARPQKQTTYLVWKRNLGYTWARSVRSMQPAVRMQCVTGSEDRIFLCIRGKLAVVKYSVIIAGVGRWRG
jgi:hypothetical protein